MSQDCTKQERQPRPARTDDERRAVLSHVGYEVLRCAQCSVAWPNAKADHVAKDRAWRDAEQRLRGVEDGDDYEQEAAAEAEVQATLAPKNQAAVVVDALLEAQLVHARNIIEFLIQSVSDRPNRADLLRTDFLPFGVDDWTPGPNSAVGTLNRHIQTINRHLSHLSWDRIVRPSNKAKEWDYPGIAWDVLAVAQAWRAFLDQHTTGLTTADGGLGDHLLWAQTLLGPAPARGRMIAPTNSTLLTASTSGSFDN